ncbi:MAG: methylated-DNA--[protein]-cysteine S-methyltransferase [Rhodococcus sp.]|nr:methylated-DNA--[protein]-cysteine S-methyltransferase [Rhodococcus sp. (in: high G+C Gram-positive bacteria)]
MVDQDVATTRLHTVIASPIGSLTLVAVGTSESGASESGAFALCGVYMAEHRPAPMPEKLGTRGDAEIFETAAAQLEQYFQGEREDFDVPLHASGTEFQRSVWTQLATIPYGQTWTYGQLADKLGRPSAVRAVASANARNPLSIVVPCHRVVGQGGKLTGYAGGLERKTFLLDLERG